MNVNSKTKTTYQSTESYLFVDLPSFREHMQMHTHHRQKPQKKEKTGYLLEQKLLLVTKTTIANELRQNNKISIIS